MKVQLDITILPITFIIVTNAAQFMSLKKNIDKKRNLCYNNSIIKNKRGRNK